MGKLRNRECLVQGRVGGQLLSGGADTQHLVFLLQYVFYYTNLDTKMSSSICHKFTVKILLLSVHFVPGVPQKRVLHKRISNIDCLMAIPKVDSLSSRGVQLLNGKK